MEDSEREKRGDSHFALSFEWPPPPSVSVAKPPDAPGAVAFGPISEWRPEGAGSGDAGVVRDLPSRFAAARRSSSAGACLQKFTSCPGEQLQHRQQQQREQQEDEYTELHPSNTENDIVNAYEQAAGGDPLLEDHSATLALQEQQQEEQQEEEQQKQQAQGSTSLKHLPTYVHVKYPISRRSFQRLIIKQFPSTPMRSSAIRLCRAFNGYLLDDSTGELGIDRLPFYEGKPKAKVSNPKP